MIDNILFLNRIWHWAQTTEFTLASDGLARFTANDEDANDADLSSLRFP